MHPRDALRSAIDVACRTFTRPGPVDGTDLDAAIVLRAALDGIRRPGVTDSERGYIVDQQDEMDTVVLLFSIALASRCHTRGRPADTSMVRSSLATIHDRAMHARCLIGAGGDADLWRRECAYLDRRHDAWLRLARRLEEVERRKAA